MKKSEAFKLEKNAKKITESKKTPKTNSYSFNQKGDDFNRGRKNKLSGAIGNIFTHLIGIVGAAWFLERFLKLGSILIAGTLQLISILFQDSGLPLFLEIRAEDVNNINEILINNQLDKFSFLTGEAYEIFKSNFLLDKIGFYIIYFYLIVVIITLIFSVIAFLFNKEIIIGFALGTIFSTLFWGGILAWIFQKAFNLGTFLAFYLNTMIGNNVSISEIFTYKVYIPRKFDLNTLGMDISLYYVLAMFLFLIIGILIAILRVKLLGDKLSYERNFENQKSHSD